jgi:hypothetical protein
VHRRGVPLTSHSYRPVGTSPHARLGAAPSAHDASAESILIWCVISVV